MGSKAALCLRAVEATYRCSSRTLGRKAALRLLVAINVALETTLSRASWPINGCAEQRSAQKWRMVAKLNLTSGLNGSKAPLRQRAAMIVSLNSNPLELIPLGDLDGDLGHLEEDQRGSKAVVSR